MATSSVRKFNSRSIRFRLTTWYAALLALTFGCAGGLVWMALGHSVTASIDKQLRARLATVRTYVEQEATGPGAAHIREELNEDAVVTAGSDYLRITAADGPVLYTSPNAAKWPVSMRQRPRLPSPGLPETVVVGGKLFRVLTAPVSIGMVQIGLPIDEFHDLEQEFLWSMTFGAPLLLVVATVAGYWMSGRALRPVDRIAIAAEQITSANLSYRLPCSGTGDELDRLSQVLNGMLAGLESAFRRIVQFTADASHELRTPLAIIRTTAELMRGRLRTSEEHERAWASVMAQTERTTHLVDDLLTLARADADVDPVSLKSVDVADVVSAAVSEMQVVASSVGVHLRFAASGHPIVRANVEALGRVLTILVDNAIKATLPGGLVEVRVEADHQAQSGSAAVTVRDTGAGIAEEDLPYIFDRFYRASKDRSRETGGAGLGLAIARSIVTQHGGHIQVKSQIGYGSTFRVTLPVLTGAESIGAGISERTRTSRSKELQSK